MNRVFALIGLAVFGLAACSGDTSSESDSSIPLAPTDWTERSTSCGFSFRAPDDLRLVSVQPIDSCVVQFENASCTLTADYGGYSDPLDWTESESDFTQSQVTIDGREAKVVSVAVADNPRPHVTAVHFPEVLSGSPGVKLTVWIGCTDSASRDELKPLAGTIRFD